MTYRSEDGRIFDSVQKLCEYEQFLEAKKRGKEEYDRERLSKLDEINLKYGELQGLISEFKRNFGRDFNGYFIPDDLFRMLRK